jgi:uncharacterized membrane protein
MREPVPANAAGKTSPVNNRQRLGTPDLLKGTAVILMIQVHLFELFARPQVQESLIGKIALFLGGPPAAPVFMAAMGYFLAHTRKSTTQLVSRGVKLMLGGLLLNLGLNLHLLIRIYNGTIQLNPLEYIFGVDILLLAGMSIIIIALLRLVFRQQFRGYFILALLAAFSTPYLPGFPGENSALKYIFAYLGGSYRWSYFPLFPWLAYPLLGYSFYLLIGDSSSFRYVKWFGRHVTAAYVFQWLIIGNTATAIFGTQSLAEVILWFTGIMVSTSLLVYLWTEVKPLLRKKS